MKRTVSLVLAFVMCLSLCACGVSLTAEQKEAKASADKEFELLCESIPDNSYSSSVKKIDGQYVYIVRLTGPKEFSESTAQTFSNLMFPAICDILCPVNIHPVLYLGDQYRIVDTPHISTDILD